MDFSRLAYFGEKAGDVITVVIFMAVIVILTRFISYRLKKSLSDKLKEGQLSILIKVINISIVLVAFSAILTLVGTDLSSLLVAWGVTGIIIGFASQSVVSNLVSGLFLLMERPIKVGDVIHVDTITGTVIDVNTLATALRTFDGLFVRVPNERVFTSAISNLTSNVARRFDYEIGIRYSDDADRAIGILTDLINEHPLTLINPQPLVYVDRLADSSVVLLTRIWAPSSYWFTVKTELLWSMKDELEKNGIVVPFPQRTIWYAKGSDGSEDMLKDAK